MEEKNITNQTNEVKQTKPAPQAKAKKKDNDKDTFADKMDSGDSRYAQLFTPLTFYHGPAARMLRRIPRYN